jgi:hypothetical protein
MGMIQSEIAKKMMNFCLVGRQFFEQTKKSVEWFLSIHRVNLGFLAPWLRSKLHCRHQMRQKLRH